MLLEHMLGSLPRPEPIVLELDNRNSKTTKKILELENQHTDPFGECDICMESDAKMGYVLEPCLHTNICISCIKQLRSYQCPFCRADIQHVRMNQ